MLENPLTLPSQMIDVYRRTYRSGHQREIFWQNYIRVRKQDGAAGRKDEGNIKIGKAVEDGVIRVYTKHVIRYTISHT